MIIWIEHTLVGVCSSSLLYHLSMLMKLESVTCIFWCLILRVCGMVGKGKSVGAECWPTRPVTTVGIWMDDEGPPCARLTPKRAVGSEVVVTTPILVQRTPTGMWFFRSPRISVRPSQGCCLSTRLCPAKTKGKTKGTY